MEPSCHGSQVSVLALESQGPAKSAPAIVGRQRPWDRLGGEAGNARNARAGQSFNGNRRQVGCSGQEMAQAVCRVVGPASSASGSPASHGKGTTASRLGQAASSQIPGHPPRICWIRKTRFALALMPSVMLQRSHAAPPSFESTIPFPAPSSRACAISEAGVQHSCSLHRFARKRHIFHFPREHCPAGKHCKAPMESNTTSTFSTHC